MCVLWDLVGCPTNKGFNSSLQTRHVVNQFVKSRLGFHSIVSTSSLGGGLSRQTFQGQRFDENGESTMGVVIEGSLIYIDSSTGTSAIEDDIEFGCSLGPIRRDRKSKEINKKREEEEETKEEQEGTEAFLTGGVRGSRWSRQSLVLGEAGKMMKV
ncbi:hypothetical protein PanWU01x14_320160 [Parasponia andersonii]|uniref:Uncharacterized protein n=1 Tax=Parasponia andersonii TaxID=3476 RepID=A0A2P5ALR3_PARAD|nr:hypothetical protein PanWU01x14_320160 [Parasponia andersonii]